MHYVHICCIACLLCSVRVISFSFPTSESLDQGLNPETVLGIELHLRDSCSATCFHIHGLLSVMIPYKELAKHYD